MNTSSRSRPDKGKDTAVRLDWDDSELFAEIVAQRVRASTGLEGTARELWGELCVSHVAAEDTLNYVVDRTLMRPRDLLLFLRKLVEVAVNRGHLKIEVDDIPLAERQYSEDMLLNTSYEIADTDPAVADALYVFHGMRPRLSYAEVGALLLEAGIPDEQLHDALDILLWFGFIGVATENAELYSHTVQYNIVRLRKLAAQAPFVIHPAFRAGLGIRA